MKQVTSSKRIEQMAVPRIGEDVFATGGFESDVSVWSFTARKLVKRLETILDFGGERLAMSSSKWPIVASGSWTDGISAYDCSTGKILWERRDLKNIQQVCDLSTANVVRFGVGTETGCYYVLDGKAGINLFELRDVFKVFPSNFGELYLCASRRSAQLSNLNGTTPIWKRNLESFAVLHATFSPSLVAYAEAAGAVFCCDFFGRELWRFIPAPGEHVRSIVWNPYMNSWLGLSHRYETGTAPYQLRQIEGETIFRPIAKIEAGSDAKFFPSGQYLVTATGAVVSTVSGKVVWQFGRIPQ